MEQIEYDGANVKFRQYFRNLLQYKRISPSDITPTIRNLLVNFSSPPTSLTVLTNKYSTTTTRMPTPSPLSQISSPPLHKTHHLLFQLCHLLPPQKITTRYLPTSHHPPSYIHPSEDEITISINHNTSPYKPTISNDNYTIPIINKIDESPLLN